MAEAKQTTLLILAHMETMATEGVLGKRQTSPTPSWKVVQMGYILAMVHGSRGLSL